MNQEIKSDYQLTVSDLLEAQQLNKHQFHNWKSNLLIIVLMLYCLVQEIYRLQDPDFMVISYFQQQGIEQSHYDSWSPIFFFSLVILVYLGEIFPKLNPLYHRNLAKDYHNNYLKQEPKQIFISSTGLTITSQNFRQFRRWHGFRKLAENQKIFLLYYGRDSEATIIPKRIFQEPAELEYFRGLVNANKKPLGF